MSIHPGGRVAADIGPAADRRRVPLVVVDLCRPELRGRFGNGILPVRPDPCIAGAADEAPAEPWRVLDRVGGA